MELRSYKNILALRRRSGPIWAFHQHNIEVAELDEVTWEWLGLEGDARARHPHGESVRNALNDWNMKESPEAADVPVPRGISTYSVNIAQICNLHCSYCAAGGDGSYGGGSPNRAHRPAVFEQLRRVITSKPRGDDLEIAFFGGEPLLYPKLIREIADDARSLAAAQGIDLRFSIITNGTLFSEKNVELLADLKCRVTVSWDGQPAEQDKFRRVKGAGQTPSSAQVREGIVQLMRRQSDLGGVHVNCVRGAHNEKMDILAAYRYLRQFNFDTYNFVYAASSGLAIDGAASDVYIKEMELLAEAVFFEEGLLGLTRISQFRRTLLRLESQTRLRNYCLAGKGLFYSDTQNDQYECSWWIGDSDEKVGSEGNLDSRRREMMAPALVQLNDCGSCWARYLCGGGCMFINKLKNGDRHQKDATFCQRTRRLAALSLDYYLMALTEKVTMEESTNAEDDKRAGDGRVGSTTCATDRYAI